ncbi:hypothetical protein DFA_00579 [Cavenderia fasciculata]|uniref:Uncharacterized protein n=1 Tax=Cavenderia fasciculata TaxID=261658 RepID=F4PSM5_CACFS|nr:uncharacterized protein DFA_00579 [Cavenderia fasciculata]EGG20717.1 hypothetical protein DFA_00579 [Cavenderia fasciculata]|eukprot:XP_004358567.1 hypothetical protein DFA_00579 [Cavenderia fasciculata]
MKKVNNINSNNNKMRSLFKCKAPNGYGEEESYYSENTWGEALNRQQTITTSVATKPNDIFLNAVDQKSKEKLQVKLSIKEWNDLIKEKAKLAESLYSINSASYVGFAEFSCIELQCQFDIFVFQHNQTVPLLPSSMALKSSSIMYTEHIKDQPSKLDQMSSVGVENSALQFFPERPGRYQVNLDVFSNYLTPKKNGFGFSTPKSTTNNLTINVPKEVQIKIDPSSNQEEEIFNDSGSRVTKAISNFPPTNYVKIQWTDLESKIDESSSGSNVSPPPLLSSSSAQPVASQKPIIEATKATVQQYTLCSVGEGVVIVTNSIKYSMVSGSLSSFEVVVGNILRVQSVDGNNIKKWDCTPIGPSSTSTENLLKILLNSPVESDYILTVVSEIPMDRTSGQITLPSVRCRGSEISREKGFLVVESTANVEVEQTTRESLTLIDKSEIPGALTDMTSGPILLAYKFLDPHYRLCMTITKHSDLQVLVAFCESAHFIATLSSEGSLLKKLIFKIRNTQQQYIRISIDHEFEIWSTIVGTNAVKPALDENGTIMIPLNKSRGSEKGVQKAFTVELVYKHRRDLELHGTGGNVQVCFPQIDIPISNLCVSLYLPKTFKYGQCKGNIKEVGYYPQGQPIKEDSKNEQTAKPRRAMPQMQIQQQQTQFMSNAMPLFDGGLTLGGGGGGAEREKETAGLKPVIVNIPTTGILLRFHQLLVLSTPIDITTKYSPNKGGYEERVEEDEGVDANMAPIYF